MPLVLSTKKVARFAGIHLEIVRNRKESYQDGSLVNSGPFGDQKWSFEESTLSFIRYFGDQDLSKFNFRAVWVDRKVVRHFHQIEIIPNTIRKRSMQFETKISKGTAFRLDKTVLGVNLLKVSHYDSVGLVP